MTGSPRADDPALVDGYRVLGRLGEGGQGVVYLAEEAGGRRVAVKLLGAGLDDPEARARFRQEIGFARRVKAFCTAQVLATGESGGTPYVVSEYVDGPSLAQVIQDRGPLRGAELRRLAIGTLTALAAIHRAGVVHRDFKPGNVLLSRDGPRVIDFGISRALEESELTGEFLVGTPPYMAPEQFAGRPAGPPADLFAWAATLVCAATGRPPFGTGEVPALINRILRDEPRLDGLDGELRALAARCLDKNPEARPAATEALLTLLGHPVPERRLLAEGQRSAAPPGEAERTGAETSGRGRRWLVAGGAVATAVAVTAGVLLLRPHSTPSPTPSAVPVAPAPRTGPMALTSTSELKIPGTGITLHENPDDPVWVSSYHDRRPGGEHASWVRDPATGAFAFFGDMQEPIVSPGGGYVASLPGVRLSRTDFETVVLRDRVTGWSGEIRTVDKPATLLFPAWSEDGGRLVATAVDTSEKPVVSVGFVVLDAARRSVTFTRVQGGGDEPFGWSPDGGVLQATAGGALRVHDLSGRLLRTFTEAGRPLRGGAARTTLGAVFATTCPKRTGRVCYWDVRTGVARGETRLPRGGTFSGWLDEGHFLGTVPGEGRSRAVVMMDLKGKVVRTLAEGPADEIENVVLWYTRR
ncbi:serine/threonine-protein kinase [Nonomuraea wenchangensis]